MLKQFLFYCIPFHFSYKMLVMMVVLNLGCLFRLHLGAIKYILAFVHLCDSDLIGLLWSAVRVSKAPADSNAQPKLRTIALN